MSNLTHFLIQASSTTFLLTLPIALTILVIAAFFQISSIRHRKNGDMARYKKSVRTYRTGFVCFGALIAINLGFNLFTSHVAAQDVATFLSTPIESVEVDGCATAHNDALIEAMRNMCNIAAHHSSPTQRYELLLKSANGNLNLELARDSTRKDEYWAYYREHNVTNVIEIGKVCLASLPACKQ
jgi:hypothetical protein